MTVFYSLIWNYLLMWPTISFFNDVSIIWIGRLTKMMFLNKKIVENKKKLDNSFKWWMSKLGIINANFIYVAMKTSGIYFEF